MWEADLPDSGDWLTTGQAAAIWSRAKGTHVTGKHIWRWYRTGSSRVDGMRFHFRGPYMFIERQSLVDSLRRRLTAGLAALDEEDGRNPERR